MLGFLVCLLQRRFKMASKQAGAVASQEVQSKHANSTTIKDSILQTQSEQRNRLLDEYFVNTKLLQVVQDFMANLATNYKTHLRLPANPFPELLKTIRMHELRQAFFIQSSSSSNPSLKLAVLNGQTSTPSQFQVCSVEHEQFALPIWGMKPTLERLTGANLYSLLELVNSAFQALVTYKLILDDDCRAIGYGVLVGNSTLGTRVQDLQPCFLEFETHVFVSGLHLEKAMAVFARFLLKQLHEAANAEASFAALPLHVEEAKSYRGCIACNGIAITSSPEVELPSHDTNSVVWSIDRVKENRATFINAVKTALVSNSIITLNRYDLAKLPNFNGSYLYQAEQTFFFHFTMEDRTKPVDSKSAKNTASRQSFLTGSRALATGIFFHSQGALEIASRFRAEALQEEERQHQSQKKKQVVASTAPTVVVVLGVKPRAGFVRILQDTVDELHRIGLTNEVFRQQADHLVRCCAYNLGYLVGAHQVFEDVLCGSKGSATMAIMIRASFMGLETPMKRFLEESDASPPTSVLHPICSLIHQFYDEVKTASAMEDEQQISDFVEALRCVNELLLVVIRIVFDDFIRLVRKTTASSVAPATTNAPVEMQAENPATVDEIDVLRALELAVEERKYPSSIVSEVIFAQAIIDFCLDVALESAVMNTVAHHLPPNPFIDMSKNLQVFALRQLVWRHELQLIPPKGTTKISRPGSPEIILMEDTNICSVNPRLLQLVSGDQLIHAHRWLMEQHIFHEGAYKPSKSSYSVAIVPMMLIYHPLLFTKPSSNDTKSLSLMDELDTVEHYIVEGKEYAQARLYFIEAVHSDLRRIASACGSSSSSNGSNCWQLRAKSRVFDHHGQVVTEFDLSPLSADDFLTGILEEATQTQLLFQVVIEFAEVQTQGDISSLVIHKVTKAYTLDHHSTDDHDATTGLSTHLSPLISFRMLEFGVFFSKENAVLCLQSVELDASHTGIPRDEWTPYASEALRNGDRFLLYELDVISSRTTLSSQQHREIELAFRLIVHSDICQLYSLEQAIRWLLDAVQTRLQRPSTLFNIHHRLTLQIIAQMEQLVVSLNYQLHFLHEVSGALATLRKHVAQWQAVQPPTEEQLELQRKQQDKTPEVLPTPREDPVIITTALVGSLRTTLILALFFRFSYQRAFFANADSR